MENKNHYYTSHITEELMLNYGIYPSDPQSSKYFAVTRNDNFRESQWKIVYTASQAMRKMRGLKS